MPTGLYGLRINVDDLDAEPEIIKQNDGTIVGGSFYTEWTSVYAVKDVDGNNIFHHYQTYISIPNACNKAFTVSCPSRQVSIR